MIKNNKKEKIKKPLASFFILHSSFRGFTLLELMVTIAIIGILSTIGIVSLNSSRNQAKLKNAQTEVAMTIKLAQSYALQGKKCLGGVVPNKYSFHIKDSNDYSIQCDGADAENYSLSGGVTFSPTIGDISFDVPHANITFSSESMKNINFQSGSASGSININGRGEVTIN